MHAENAGGGIQLPLSAAQDWGLMTAIYLRLLILLYGSSEHPKEGRADTPAVIKTAARQPGLLWDVLHVS